MEQSAAQWPRPRAVDRARSQFFTGDRFDVDGVRDEILRSWRRSRLLGADPSPSEWELPYDPRFDRESPLLRAATPVLDRLAEHLTGEDAALILSDRDGRIVARRVGEHSLLHELDHINAAEGFVYSEDNAGTNGLGTAIETGHPIEVVGSEHYAERLAELTCIGIPLTHPVTRQLVGVMDITCPAKRTNTLLRPLVAQAAHDITERLYMQRNVGERALLRHFMQASRSCARGVVAINDHCMISNATASRMLVGIEHGLLWEQVGGVLRYDAPCDLELETPAGHPVRLRIVPLRDGSVPVGVLLEVRLTPMTDSWRAAPGEEAPPLPGLAGHSAAWRTCCADAWRAARNTGEITLIGEPGTGKSALATALHQALRTGRPLVVAEGGTACLNSPSSWLTAIRDRVAASVPGTLVVRDLQLLSPALTRSLRSMLRDLRQSGWLLIATETLAGEGHAAAVPEMRVEVPPLRERLGDIPALVAEFTGRHVGVPGHRREISPEVVRTFQRMTWPGNVAELKALVDSLCAPGRNGQVRVSEIPGELLCTASRRPLTRLERAEVHTILATLRATRGNKKEAAALLGISRSTLYRKLRSVGIDLGDSP